MRELIHAVITWEEDIYVAQALEFDVASQGETEEEAIENLKEAARLYIQETGHLPEWQVVPVEVDIGASPQAQVAGS